MAARPLTDASRPVPGAPGRSSDARPSDALEEELAGWGKVALVETRGRTTGRPQRAAVGFVAEPDGSFLVAAGDHDADWALNLIAEPRCVVTIGDRRIDAEGLELDGPDRARAIRELILRYGTPSERLGLGPAFRLVPRTTDADDEGSAG